MLRHDASALFSYLFIYLFIWNSAKLFVPPPPFPAQAEVSSDRHFIISSLEDFRIKVLEGRTNGKINKQELCRNVLIEEPRTCCGIWLRHGQLFFFCFVLSHFSPSRKKKGFSGLWFSVWLKRKNCDSNEILVSSVQRRAAD